MSSAIENSTEFNTEVGWLKLLCESWENTTSASDDITAEEHKLKTCETHYQLMFLFNGVGLILICCIGILVNSLSITVLVQKAMRCVPINILLTCLQISDLLVVSSLIFTWGLPSVFDWTDPNNFYMTNINPWARVIAIPITFAAYTGSIYFTILVTIERYIAVCHPFKVSKFSARRAVQMCTFVGIFSILFNIPCIWDLGIKYDSDAELYVNTETEFSTTKFYNYYLSYISLVFLYMIPFPIIFICNFKIYRHLQKSAAVQKVLMLEGRSSPPEEETHNANPAPDNSLTYLLFSIVIIFLICNSFQLLNDLSWDLDFHSGRFFFWIIRPFKNLFLAFNSSVNFFIYCLFGTKFRTQLVILVKNNWITNKLSTMT